MAMIEAIPARALCLVILMAAAAGCGSTGPTGPPDMSGPPSSVDICHAKCLWKRICTPPGMVTCDMVCEANAGTSLDYDKMNDAACKNAPAGRRQTLACLTLNCPQGQSCQSVCDASQTCLNAIDTTCIPP